jgi:hypothetical protein
MADSLLVLLRNPVALADLIARWMEFTVPALDYALLARKAKCDPTCLRNAVEHADPLSPRTLSRIIAAFRLSAEEFVAGPPEHETAPEPQSESAPEPEIPVVVETIPTPAIVDPEEDNPDLPPQLPPSMRTADSEAIRIVCDSLCVWNMRENHQRPCATLCPLWRHIRVRSHLAAGKTPDEAITLVTETIRRTS